MTAEVFPPHGLGRTLASWTRPNVLGQGVVLAPLFLFAILVVVANLVVDALYAVPDPKARWC